VVETTTDRVLELTLSFFFAVDLLMGLYVCDHRIWFWVKPDVVRKQWLCIATRDEFTSEHEVLKERAPFKMSRAVVDMLFS